MKTASNWRLYATLRYKSGSSVWIRFSRTKSAGATLLWGGGRRRLRWRQRVWYERRHGLDVGGARSVCARLAGHGWETLWSEGSSLRNDRFPVKASRRRGFLCPEGPAQAGTQARLRRPRRTKLSGSGLEPYLEFKAFFKGPKEKKRFGEFRL